MNEIFFLFVFEDSLLYMQATVLNFLYSETTIFINRFYKVFFSRFYSLLGMRSHYLSTSENSLTSFPIFLSPLCFFLV